MFPDAEHVAQVKLILVKVFLDINSLHTFKVLSDVPNFDDSVRIRRDQLRCCFNRKQRHNGCTVSRHFVNGVIDIRIPDKDVMIKA